MLLLPWKSVQWFTKSDGNLPVYREKKGSDVLKKSSIKRWANILLVVDRTFNKQTKENVCFFN